jgi:hypothetical protein
MANKPKLEQMIVQSEMNISELTTMVKRLIDLPPVALLGYRLVVHADKAEDYAKALFDLLPGELMAVEPFIELVADREVGQKLRHFPSSHGSFNNWPFSDGATGITVIVGGTGSAKSELMANGFKPAVTLRVSEPHEKFDSMGGAMHPVDLDDLMSTMVVLCSQRIPFGVDSFRKLAYELDGAAGSQGIIAKLYTAMTDLNNFCSFMDMNIPVILNPMVKGEEAEEHVYSNMAGSVSGALHLVNGVVVKSLIRRKDRRSPVESGDFIAQQKSTQLIGTDEKVDEPRISLSRASKADTSIEVGLETVSPLIDPSNIDMDEDTGRYDEARSGTPMRS